jgi:hypothetical protein
MELAAVQIIRYTISTESPNIAFNLEGGIIC